MTYKLTEKTGKLLGVVPADENGDVMLITSEGIVIRMHVDEISTFGRQTQGVRLMRLADGVQCVSFAITDRDEEETEEEGADISGDELDGAADDSEPEIEF